MIFATSTGLAIIGSVFTDQGLFIAATLLAVVSAAGVLVGLGFAWRHMTKRVTGKKF